MTAALPLLDSGEDGTFGDVWLTVGALILGGAVITFLGEIVWTKDPNNDFLFAVGFGGFITALLWPVILPIAVVAASTWQLRRVVQRRRAKPKRRAGEGMMAPDLTPREPYAPRTPKERYASGEIELDEFERLTE